MPEVGWLTKQEPDEDDKANDPCFGFLVGTNSLAPEFVEVKIENPTMQSRDLMGTFTSFVGASPAYLGGNQPPLGYLGAVIYQKYVNAPAFPFHRMLMCEQPIADRVADLRKTVSTFPKMLPNWDGEGAEPISMETTATALRLIEQISMVVGRKNTCAIPSVRPFPDGSIFFKWIQGQKELTFTVEARKIEAQRWEPLDSFRSQGLWDISVDDAAEQIEWLLP